MSNGMLAIERAPSTISMKTRAATMYGLRSDALISHISKRPRETDGRAPRWVLQLSPLRSTKQETTTRQDFAAGGSVREGEAPAEPTLARREPRPPGTGQRTKLLPHMAV